MKTKRILAASTAALLAVSAAALPASAAETAPLFPENPFAAATDAAVNAAETVLLLNDDNIIFNDDDPVVISPEDADAPEDEELGDENGIALLALQPRTAVNVVSGIDPDDGTLIGGGITARITEKNLDKYDGDDDDYSIEATETAVADDSGKVDVTGTIITDLDAKVKNDLKKLDSDKVAIRTITLTNGRYVEPTAPTDIKFTLTLSFEPTNIYHVNDGKLENVKVNQSDIRKKVDNTWEVTFTARRLGDFIFTGSAVKSAVNGTADATTGTDVSTVDNEGVDIGAGVTAALSTKDQEIFEDKDYTLAATTVFDASVISSDDKVNIEDIPELDGLSKSLKNEIKKIKQKEFHVVNIDLAEGRYIASTSPVAIKLTINVPFKPIVYHVNGDKVEKLTSNARMRTDGTWDVSFSTKNFSPFIFTTADLKNAVAAPADSQTTSSGTTSSTTTTTTPGNNSNTGISLAIAPVVLAAGVVAVVASKKKR